MGKFEKGHKPWNKGKSKENKAPIDWRIVAIAIICISVIEIVALCNGINGTILTLVVGIVAGLAGLSLPQLKLKRF